MFRKVINKAINQMIVEEWEYQGKIIKSFAKDGLLGISKGSLSEARCNLGVAFSDLRIDYLKAIRNGNGFFDYLFASLIIAWFKFSDWLYRGNS